MPLAANAAYVVAKAVAGIDGVALTVGVFPHGYLEECVLEIKGFGDKPKPENFCNLCAGGGTPMAEAILWGGHVVAYRPEPRKIVVLFTDGQPDSVRNTVKTVNILKEKKIDFFLVSLDAEVSWARDADINVGNIESIKELGPALIGLLQKALVRNKR